MLSNFGEKSSNLPTSQKPASPQDIESAEHPTITESASRLKHPALTDSADTAFGENLKTSGKNTR